MTRPRARLLRFFGRLATDGAHCGRCLQHPRRGDSDAFSPSHASDRQLSNKEEYKRRHQLGFIAQDLAKVLPQLVDTDEFSGLESVGYMGVIPILVEAIKEQQVQIDELKAK